MHQNSILILLQRSLCFLAQAHVDKKFENFFNGNVRYLFCNRDEEQQELVINYFGCQMIIYVSTWIDGIGKSL